MVTNHTSRQSCRIYTGSKSHSNITTKIAPYTALFGRKISTPYREIIFLSYREIIFFYLDRKRGLKQPKLNAEPIWNIKTNSESELDIRFNNEQPDEDSASDNSILQNVGKRRPNVRIFHQSKSHQINS